MVSASWPAAAELWSTPSSLAPRKHNSQRLQGGRDGSVCTEAHREVVCGCSQNGYFHKSDQMGVTSAGPKHWGTTPFRGEQCLFVPRLLSSVCSQLACGPLLRSFTQKWVTFPQMCDPKAVISVSELYPTPQNSRGRILCQERHGPSFQTWLWVEFLTRWESSERKSQNLRRNVSCARHQKCVRSSERQPSWDKTLVRSQPLGSASAIRNNTEHLLPIFCKPSKSSKPRSPSLQSLPLSFWALSVFFVLPFSFSSSYGASKHWLLGPAGTGISPLSPSQLWSRSERAPEPRARYTRNQMKAKHFF